MSWSRVATVVMPDVSTSPYTYEVTIWIYNSNLAPCHSPSYPPCNIMPGNKRSFERHASVAQQRRLSVQLERNSWLGPSSDVRVAGTGDGDAGTNP
jgi:hypothetical protein